MQAMQADHLHFNNDICVEGTLTQMWCRKRLSRPKKCKASASCAPVGSGSKFRLCAITHRSACYSPFYDCPLLLKQAPAYRAQCVKCKGRVICPCGKQK